jgi:hypothetical protein
MILGFWDLLAWTMYTIGAAGLAIHTWHNINRRWPTRPPRPPTLRPHVRVIHPIYDQDRDPR